MGEPGGLLSMGSHRVGHDCSDLAAALGPQESDMTQQLNHDHMVLFGLPWWLSGTESTCTAGGRGFTPE